MRKHREDMSRRGGPGATALAATTHDPFASLETRVGQLEVSLSTAIQALTELLQDREKPAQVGGGSNHPQCGAEALKEGTMRQELSALQKENVLLAARVQTLEGYMKAVLRFVEAHEKEQLAAPSCPSPLRSGAAHPSSSGSESPVLEERVTCARLSPALAQPHGTAAGSSRDRQDEKAGHAGLVSLIDARIALQRSVTEDGRASSRDARVEADATRQARDVALEVVQAALYKERELSRLERQSELAAFRTSVMAGILDKRSADADQAANKGSSGGVEQDQAAHSPSKTNVRSAAAEASAESRRPEESLVALTARVAALEAAKEPRTREQGIALLQSLYEGLAGDLRALQRRVAGLLKEGSRAGWDGDATLSAEGISPHPSPQPQQPSYIKVRQELMALFEAKLQQAVLDMANLQEAATTQHERAVARLREDQQSLRGAVRALVTPSVVLHGLDHRLRVLREDVHTLQQQQQQRQQQQFQGHRELWPSVQGDTLGGADARDSSGFHARTEPIRPSTRATEPQHLSRRVEMAPNAPGPSRPFKVPSQKRALRKGEAPSGRHELGRAAATAAPPPTSSYLRDLVNSRDQASHDDWPSAASGSSSGSVTASVTEVSLNSEDDDDHHHQRNVQRGPHGEKTTKVSRQHALPPPSSPSTALAAAAAAAIAPPPPRAELNAILSGGATSQRRAHAPVVRPPSTVQQDPSASSLSSRSVSLEDALKGGGAMSALEQRPDSHHLAG